LAERQAGELIAKLCGRANKVTDAAAGWPSLLKARDCSFTATPELGAHEAHRAVEENLTDRAAAGVNAGVACHVGPKLGRGRIEPAISQECAL
jgi:hypothetical protein